MAEYVGAFGVPHTPLLWRLRDDREATDLRPVFHHFQLVREMLAECRPDAIVVIASDHIHQYTIENMPAFAIGKAERIRGTFPNEERAFGLPPIELQGDVALAEAIAGADNLTASIDFSFTNRPWLDHAYVVPLLEVVPDLDIPVVPIHTNTNAPPIPTAERFAALGSTLREAIVAAPDERRVAVVATGHLALDLGGPGQFIGTTPDPDFDHLAMQWMRDADLEAALTGSTFERLRLAGNLSFQFLDFVTLLASARGRPDLAEGIECRFGTEPFFAWRNP
jgi:aromatic ring-opening dioxygenase catalytic subunit (LigB family)